MKTTAAIMIAAVMLAGCGSTPSPQMDAERIEKAEAAGLECRDIPNPRSPKRTYTACASSSEWARYEEDQRESAEALRDDIRRDNVQAATRMSNSMATGGP